MKKQILAIALAIMSMSTIPTYAATITAGASKSETQAQSEASSSTEQKSESDNPEGITWLVPRGLTSGEYMREYGVTQWDWAEGVAQARKWAQENKDGITDTTDQKAQYEAIVKKVCDFLTYDEVYYAPHIAYTIRDGRGVCADYTTLTKALCDVYNIQTTIVMGGIEGVSHNLLKVVINGEEYYSDPTNYDAGSAPMYQDGVPSYFTITYELSSNDLGTSATGGDVDNDCGVLDMEARKRGEVLLFLRYDGAWYGSEEDSIALDKAYDADDMYTVYSIFDKYGIPHAN